MSLGLPKENISSKAFVFFIIIFLFFSKAEIIESIFFISFIF